MENGFSLHYPGNTVVNVPRPGRKRLAKTLDPAEPIPFEGKVFANHTPKVCAVSKCVWCGHNPGQYFITCARCGNCQYCGMVDNVDPYSCFLCGNYLPEEARTSLVKIRPGGKNDVTLIK